MFGINIISRRIRPLPASKFFLYLLLAGFFCSSAYAKPLKRVSIEYVPLFKSSYSILYNPSSLLDTNGFQDSGFPMIHNQELNILLGFEFPFSFPLSESWNLGLGIGLWFGFLENSIEQHAIDTGGNQVDTTLVLTNKAMSTMRLLTQINYQWDLGKVDPFLGFGISNHYYVGTGYAPYLFLPAGLTLISGKKFKVLLKGHYFYGQEKGVLGKYTIRPLAYNLNRVKFNRPKLQGDFYVIALEFWYK
jgi:hypothetical protein